MPAWVGSLRGADMDIAPGQSMHPKRRSDTRDGGRADLPAGRRQREGCCSTPTSSLWGYDCSLWSEFRQWRMSLRWPRPRHECFVSAASLWEIAIKARKGQLPRARPTCRTLASRQGFELLADHSPSTLGAVRRPVARADERATRSITDAHLASARRAADAGRPATPCSCATACRSCERKSLRYPRLDRQAHQVGGAGDAELGFDQGAGVGDGLVARRPAHRRSRPGWSRRPAGA